MLSIEKTYTTILCMILLVTTATVNAAQDILPIEYYAKQPQISNLKLSPNGDAVAMRTIIDNIPVLVIQNLDGSEQRYIGPRPRYEMATYYWVNNDDLLVLYRFDKSSGVKNMRFAVSKLYTFNRKTEDFVELFTPDARYAGFLFNRVPIGQNNFISWLPNDPDHVLMSARNGNERYPATFKLNIHNGKRTTVQSGREGIFTWLADRHDKIRLGYGYDWDKKTGLILYKNNSGDWVNISRDLSSAWTENKYGIYGFDTQTDLLIVSSTSSYGTHGIYKYDPETQQLVGTVMENDFYDIDFRLKDTFTQKIIGYGFYDHAFQSIYTNPLYKAAHEQMKAIFQGTDVYIKMKAKNTNKFLVEVSSEQLPTTYFLYDHDNKKMQIIAKTRPEIDSKRMAPYIPIQYKARDGLTIHGYLTLPVGKPGKNLPVVVWPHGGPQSRTTKTYSPFVQFLTNRGYAVLQPNFRGSTGYGDSFNNAMKGEWGGKMQDDVTDGTQWLIDQGIADPERICIGGISYGGYAAAMGVIKEQDLYKCAISINGLLDIKSLIDYETRFGGKDIKQKFLEINGFENDNPKDISPLYLADQIKVPMLLISAKDDLTVNWENARDMHKAMQKNSKDSEYISLDEGRHSMLTLQSRRTALAAMEKFLAKHIGE